METSIRINTSAELSKFMHLAWESSEEIGVHDHTNNIADAKSIMGLMSLDFHQPVRVISDDNKFMEKIERWKH